MEEEHIRQKRMQTRQNANMLPSFSIYHPSQKGNGTAVAMRLSPAGLRSSGYVQIELARQQTVGDAARKVFPTFNWKDRIIVRINPIEVAEIIGCLRGEISAVRGGEGFSHRTDGRASRILLSHDGDEGSRIVLKVTSETISGEEKEIAIAFDSDETSAISLALSASMGRLCFGD